MNSSALLNSNHAVTCVRCIILLPESSQLIQSIQLNSIAHSQLIAKLGSTHTRELDTAVTALGSSTLLLQVKVTELAAGSLDNADLVGPRVVPVAKFHQYMSTERVIHRNHRELSRGTGIKRTGSVCAVKSRKVSYRVRWQESKIARTYWSLLFAILSGVRPLGRWSKVGGAAVVDELQFKVARFLNLTGFVWVRLA